MNSEAKAAKREYMRKWREKNREHYKRYQRSWRKANPEKVKQYQANYWAKKVKEAN